jgi:hypothetical protein
MKKPATFTPPAKTSANKADTLEQWPYQKPLDCVTCLRTNRSPILEWIEIISPKNEPDKTSAYVPKFNVPGIDRGWRFYRFKKRSSGSRYALVFDNPPSKNITAPYPLFQKMGRM